MQNEFDIILIYSKIILGTFRFKIVYNEYVINHTKNHSGKMLGAFPL